MQMKIQRIAASSGFGHNYPDYAEDALPTAEMFLEDGLAMTEFLCEHLGKEKITLLGHSWGSTYASTLALAYPEKYDACIAKRISPENSIQKEQRSERKCSDLCFRFPRSVE